MPSITFQVSDETKRLYDQMSADFGFTDRADLLRFLCKMNADGLLLIVNKATKDALIAASEERVVKVATRTAREATHYVLWEEGYRATPYET